MKKSKGSISIIVMIALVIIIGGGALYLKSTDETVSQEVSETASSTLTFDKTTTSDQIIKTKVGEVKITSTSTSPVTVNCGSQNCFDIKFAACEPATFSTNGGPLGFVEYKILSKTAKGCNVSFKYIKGPIETPTGKDWTGMEMTCPYNNKIAFEKANGEAFQGVIEGKLVCTGSYYEVLRTISNT